MQTIPKYWQVVFLHNDELDRLLGMIDLSTVQVPLQLSESVAPLHAPAVHQIRRSKQVGTNYAEDDVGEEMGGDLTHAEENDRGPDEDYEVPNYAQAEESDQATE